MVTFRLGGVKYQAPASWKEVTTKQYARIKRDWEPEKDIADRDYVKLLQLLINHPGPIPFDRNVENDLTLMSILGWVITEEERFPKELPKALKIGRQTYMVPQDPSELSIGQNIHLRRAIEKAKAKAKIMEEVIATAVSIYMQPIIDGTKKFDNTRAQEIAAELEDMPAFVVYPIGFFLLRRVSRYGMKPVPRWHLIRTNLVRRLGRTLPDWLRSIYSVLMKTYL